jgi:hypothetical protein
MKRMACMVALVTTAALATATVALAHPHQAEPGQGGTGQVIANGQNHGPFVNGVSCGGDPAAYGLESAHHGPDAGTPGKADDGCYQTTGGVPPAQDDTNPALG